MRGARPICGFRSPRLFASDCTLQRNLNVLVPVLLAAVGMAP